MEKRGGGAVGGGSGLRWLPVFGAGAGRRRAQAGDDGGREGGDGKGLWAAPASPQVARRERSGGRRRGMTHVDVITVYRPTLCTSIHVKMGSLLLVSKITGTTTT